MKVTPWYSLQEVRWQTINSINCPSWSRKRKKRSHLLQRISKCL